jgi:hypothetical protein
MKVKEVTHMDPDTLRSYIADARSRRDTALQYKESYNAQARSYDDQADSYHQQAEAYRQQANDYDAQAQAAQRDLDYYEAEARREEERARQARYEAAA